MTGNSGSQNDHSRHVFLFPGTRRVVGFFIRRPIQQCDYVELISLKCSLREFFQSVKSCVGFLSIICRTE